MNLIILEEGNRTLEHPTLKKRLPTKLFVDHRSFHFRRMTPSPGCQENTLEVLSHPTRPLFLRSTSMSNLRGDSRTTSSTGTVLSVYLNSDLYVLVEKTLENKRNFLLL